MNRCFHLHILIDDPIIKAKGGERMVDNGLKKEYRTYQIPIKKGHRLYNYFDNLSLHANNLYNTTNFYIRQVFTALNQDKELQKPQQEVMETIAVSLPIMNENQWKAYQTRMNKEKLKAVDERKEIKAALFDMPTKEKSFLNYPFLDCLFKTMKQRDYVALPGQLNQQVIRNVTQNWKSFFKSLKGYKQHPEKYKGRPSIPSYLDKGGRKEVVFSNQVCTIKNNKYLSFPKTKRKINIGKIASISGKFQQVRLVPRFDSYVLEVVFLIGEQQEIKSGRKRCMSIDLGIDNLAAIVTNTDHQPVLFKGGAIKAINQYYNKQKARYYSILRNGRDEREGLFTSNRLTKISRIRHHKLKDLFHKISRNIVDMAEEKDIDAIIIGKNKEWKQAINIGKRNNQAFVQIPHALLIELITYKARAQGIEVIVTEESYTSKSSFLDMDDIPTFALGDEQTYTFSGKRIKRGLYQSKSGMLLNADINGAANILRKVVPNAFANGIAAVCSPPHVVNVH